VPTVRTLLSSDEPLHVNVIIPGAPAKQAFLYWKPLGGTAFQKAALTHVARGVYDDTVAPDAIQGDFEYYVQAASGADKALRFPATAPELNQTVVVRQCD